MEQRPPRKVSFSGDVPKAFDPTSFTYGDDDDDFDEDDDYPSLAYTEGVAGTDTAGEQAFKSAKVHFTREEAMAAADHLSMRLLQVDDDDSEEADKILRESLSLYTVPSEMMEEEMLLKPRDEQKSRVAAVRRICTMVSVSIITLTVIFVIFYVGVQFVGPPNQPVGPYILLERQEGEDFFNYYSFYEGRDSVGSNGFNTYVSMQTAQTVGIVNVSYESIVANDVYRRHSRQKSRRRRRTQAAEPFVYMSSSATEAGPRDSIRLEGKRRFNRGLFVIDLRHMPAGCGVWPAFWLTDEANWPVNGEIDIVEGVNYQSVAKTALHSTKGCSMDDVPEGVKTGGWDTAVGIPDKKTGIPDMTMRFATNCFVYDPHQWINQGCVAVDKEGNGTTLGAPLNKQGGGVFALEWDPINQHIRTWVFTPHINVPDNLQQAMETSGYSTESQVAPDPETWSLPYGYFPVGDDTSCAASHFRNMRLVFNLAFCGSVCGNRYFLDCKSQSKKFPTCNDWVRSNPEEMKEAYWKIRGVYVWEREWERAWL